MKKIFFALAFFFFLPVMVLASGNMDSTYKYAWGEDIGWVNFNPANGNVQATSTGLSGYVWSENAGWINLAPSQSGVKNDSLGNLSGSAWGEKLGWINFSGVTIGTDGFFSGQAVTESNGRINFCSAAESNFCRVKTDWLAPAPVVAPSSGSSSLPPEASIKPGSPADGVVKMIINNGAANTNNSLVTLNFVAPANVKMMAISNSLDFTNVGQEPFVSEKKWELCPVRFGTSSICAKGLHTVYVKFYNSYGLASEVFSASFILSDSLAPAIPAAEPEKIVPAEKESVVPAVNIDVKLSERLGGKILLQVESGGAAWYVDPRTNKKYSLGRPDEAFQVMRERGIGITNTDLNKIPVAAEDLYNFSAEQDSDHDGYSDKTELRNGYNPNGPGKIKLDKVFAAKQKGKIFLQVEGRGEAWYVNPDNNKRYYLGRPADAFKIMTNLGLGISNSNLQKIGAGS